MISPLRKANQISRLTVGFLLGEFQRKAGWPITRPATARQALEQWLSALGELPVPRGRILITALRNHTWVEWAVYSACVFRQMGYESTLVYYGPEITRLFPEKYSRHNFWRGVKRVPGVELVDLAEIACDSSVRERWAVAAKIWAPVAVSYDLHIEEADVVDNPTRYGQRVHNMACRILDLGAALDVFLTGRRFSRCICSSGLIAESKILLDVLLKFGVETVCTEGWGWRPGHMLLNLNAPALEYNVAGWLNFLGPWDADKDAEISAYLKFLDGEKPEDAAWLDNFHLIQKSKISAELPSPLAGFLAGETPVFVLAPNVIGDSSMLRRETIFRGQQVWAREVIRYFRERPDRKLVVRAHPGEQWAGAKCGVHMGKVAREAAAGAPNVFVIDSIEKINTFSLLPFARGGLVWLSSIGVDMVVRGVPVIAAARPKYQGMGIVAEPKSTAEYFALLDRWAMHAGRPSAGQILQGKRYLHLVFKGFSLEAGGRTYRATSYLMGRMPNQKEHDRFYRILAGQEPAPDRS